MLSRTALVVLVLLCAVGSCAAQSSTNLNFEQGPGELQDPNFGFLSWDQVAPGWSHSEGNDTEIVYYGQPHVGLTQWFMLLDPTNRFAAPLSGNYSLAFMSGYYYPWGYGAWVNASVYKTAWIPSTAQALRFMATGNFQLTINGQAVPVVSLGSNSYYAGLGAFRNSVCEIRFANMNQPHDEWYLDDPVVVDNISIYPTMPEPSSLLCLMIGSLSLIPALKILPRK